MNPYVEAAHALGKLTDEMAQSPNDPATMVALVKLMSAQLAAISASQTPVPVTSNAKTGDYIIASLGAPSITTMTAGQTGVSTPFTPPGEAFSIEGALFQITTGGANTCKPGLDGYIWLECDMQGGVNYKPVFGSKFLFSDLMGPNAPGFVLPRFNCRGGAWRVGINFGTPTGTNAFSQAAGITLRART